MTKIGTWNLQNLVRPGAGSGGPSDEDAYTAKLEALARTITGLDPDVLAIQEVGDPDALRDLDHDARGDLAFGAGRPRRSRYPRGGLVASGDDAGGAGPRLPRSARPGTGRGRRHHDHRALSPRAPRPRPRRDRHRRDLGAPEFQAAQLPGGRFNPRDEDERARYAVYALTCFDVRRQEGELAAVTGSVAGSTYRPTCLIPATWRFTRAAVARMAFWRADPLVSGRTPAAGRTRQRQVRHHAPTGGRRGTLRAGRNRRSRPTR
jgi:hypothetical protein